MKIKELLGHSNQTALDGTSQQKKIWPFFCNFSKMLKTGSGTQLIINRELLCCTLLNEKVNILEETFYRTRVQI